MTKNDISTGFIFRLFFWFLLLYYAFVLISKQIEFSILDYPNLIFHEAGHLIFLLFGKVISFLGGSIIQVIIPLIITLNFLFHEKNYEACFGIFWIGQNFINISCYVADARIQALPLIGGEHDWAFLLREFGTINRAEIIGRNIFIFGSITIILALMWMGYLLVREYKYGIKDSSYMNYY